MATIEEFKRIELRVAKVLSAEPIEGSEKLVRLQVSIGEEERQVLAGIAKAYIPKDLVGRKVVMIANLEPKQLMGLESQGMILAAVGSDGVPILLRPDREVAPGTKVC